jgi:methylmalonyl-CoA mutase
LAFQKTNSEAAQRELQNLKEAALKGENIFAALMEAARVCSLNQMTQALFEVGGQYRRNL